jgi:hypothetical protein
MEPKIMSELYGEFDVDEIPDNPFNIDEEGEYTGIVSKSEIRTTQGKGDDPGLTKWVVTYEDTDEDSSQYGKNVSEWLTIYPDLTSADLAELDPSDRKQVIRDLSRVKNRLKSLGYENGQVSSVEDVTDTEVEFVVVKQTDKNDDEKHYYNVKFVKAT